MKRPLIGLTLDSEPAGGYSNLPWYAIRENYCGAVTRAGGLPLLLPHEPEHAAAYLDRVDGLIVTGGAFDVDPALFGAETRHSSVTTKDRRTDFEKSATEGALERDMPVLGICGGQQLLNVVLGGTLIQHIPDEVEGALAHEQPNPRTEPGHTVAVAPDSLLHRIVGATEMAVNSAHHQAALDVGDGVPRRRRLKRTARASGSPSTLRGPASARAARPSAGSPPDASRWTARCSTHRPRWSTNEAPSRWMASRWDRPTGCVSGAITSRAG